MSGDSFKPEEGGESVEAINPDFGNSEIEAQPFEGDAMDAAESDALKAIDDASKDDEAKEEEVLPEVVAESDDQAELDQAEPEPQVEEVAESPKLAWDGNPDNLPEELQPTYKTMLKGFHAKTRELAEERKKYEDLQAQLLLRITGNPDAAKAEDSPPPLPTGDNITQEQWNEAVTKQNRWYADWYAEQNKKELLKELKESGEFAPAEKFYELEVQNEVKSIESELMATPGFTDAHAAQMAEILNTNEFWGRAYAQDRRNAAFQLAHLVMADMGVRDAKTTAAAKADAKVKKQATAASRAGTRPTAPRGATPEDVFATTGFKNENEKMEHAERIALESIGG